MGTGKRKEKLEMKKHESELDPFVSQTMHNGSRTGNKAMYPLCITIPYIPYSEQDGGREGTGESLLIRVMNGMNPFPHTSVSLTPPNSLLSLVIVILV